MFSRPRNHDGLQSWWPAGCQCTSTSAPARCRSRASRSVSSGETMRIDAAVGNQHARPAALGQRIRLRTAPWRGRASPALSTPGRSSSSRGRDVGAVREAHRDDAGRVEAVMRRRRRSRSRRARRRGASGRRRRRRPSASRRKKRGMPFSSTLPRGLRSAAPGASARPSGSRSCSSPPVPCRSEQGAARRGLRRLEDVRRSRGRRHALIGPSCGSSRGRRRQRRQGALDLGARRLEPGRQHQRFAEVRRVLVDGESGAFGGDLEQHAARFLEVDRLEPEAIDDVGGAAAGRSRPAPGHAAAPRQIRHRPREMVDGADAPRAAPLVRRLLMSTTPGAASKP